ASDLQSGEAELVRNVASVFGGCTRVGRAHIADDLRSRRKALREQSEHPTLKQGVVAAPWIGHAVAMRKGDSALAQAFQHHDVEFAGLCQIDGRIEPGGGKSGSCPDSEATRLPGHARDSGSVALESPDVVEEKVADGSGRLPDRADRRHELCRLQYFLRL